MQIDTTIQLNDLAGKPLLAREGKPMTIGNTLAQIIIGDQSKKVDAMKAYILGVKFYGDKMVQLDESDYKSVKEMVESTQVFSPLISGQILSVFIDMDKDLPKEK